MSVARRTPSGIGIITLRSMTASDCSSFSVSMRCWRCCAVSVPCCARTMPAAATVATIVARIRRRVNVHGVPPRDSVVHDFDFAAVVGRDSVGRPARILCRATASGRAPSVTSRGWSSPSSGGAKRRAVRKRDVETGDALAEQERDQIAGFHLRAKSSVGLEDGGRRPAFPWIFQLLRRDLDAIASMAAFRSRWWRRFLSAVRRESRVGVKRSEIKSG
jgi:hypothetical protein